MKKLYTLLLLVLLTTATKAQYVTITDTAFAKFLKVNYPSAMTGNLLDTTNSLIINDTLIDCSSKGISDLHGVQYFDKLKYLFCSDNSLINLPRLPVSLVKLFCRDNHLSSLPTLPSSIDQLWVQNNNLTTLPILPSSLLELYCSDNNLTALPSLPGLITRISCSSNKLTTLPSLPSSLDYLDVSFNLLTGLSALPSSIQYLYCTDNSLTSISTLPASLKVLNCNFNKLSSLPALPGSLYQLFCYGNILSSLPTLPTSLYTLNCYSNNLTALPTLNDSLRDLTCTKNLLTSLPVLPKKLRSLYCDSNNLSSLPAIPASLKGLICDNNPSLNCLPPFTQERFTSCFQVRRNTGISCLPHSMSFGPCVSNDSTELLPVCSLLSGCPVMDKFVGNVHEDTSVSCAVDSLNNGPLSPKIKLKKYKNGILDYQVYTNSDGHYSFDGAIGDSIDVMIDTAGLSLEVSCPSINTRSGRITLSDSIIYNQDFGIKCKGIDLGVNSIFGGFRKGGTRVVYIHAGDLSKDYNLNCGDGSSGIVTITISDSAFYDSPFSGALTPSVISGNTLTYYISDFGALNWDSAFNFMLRIPATVALGSDVCIKTVVTTTATDINHTNDSLIFCGKVVNSFDPNNKLVYPTSTIGPDEWLTYTINFQNTGTDTAYHIIVRDTLNSHLNIGSFTYLASSHSPQINIMGNAVMFNFPHINLLDSFHNEPESHGWVQFKIKTIETLPINAKVSNNASIYFDDNEPILTNTTVNINEPLGLDNRNLASSFKLYPNPASSKITIDAAEAGELKIFDMLGSQVFQISTIKSHTPLTISLPKLANGLYLYQYITITNSRKIGKLTIQSN